MVAPFKCDEKVTIERRPVSRDLDYGTEVAADAPWELVASRYWANVQDVLPREAESTVGGLRQQKLRSRLRMKSAGAFTGAMRATLHGHGDRVMQIVAGPALLDDRVHYEFMLEDFSS
jgi:hypothetical protein